MECADSPSGSRRRAGPRAPAGARKSRPHAPPLSPGARTPPRSWDPRAAAPRRRCRISISSTLSDVFPAITLWMPQELLPIMPPSVQWVCVAGSGPNVRLKLSAAPRSRSSTSPGWIRARRASGSSATIRLYVLRRVADHRDVAALAAEARSAAPRQERHAKGVARRDGGDDVVDVARQDDADRDLAVVGGVAGVERAVPGVEVNLAANGRTQQLGKPLRGAG